MLSSLSYKSPMFVLPSVHSTEPKSVTVSTSSSDLDSDMPVLIHCGKELAGHQRNKRHQVAQREKTKTMKGSSHAKQLQGPRLFCQGLGLGILLTIVMGFQGKHAGGINHRQNLDVERRIRQVDPQHRHFLKSSSIYQNSITSLRSATGVPISITLEVKMNDWFELKVQNLNSRDNGSKGWFVVRGAFKVNMELEASGLQLLEPEEILGTEVFSYDASILDSTTALAFRCLQRVSTGVFHAVKLQVDAEKDAVLVTPQSAVSMLWGQPVVLRLTTKAALWDGDKPSSRRPATPPATA